MLTFPVSPHVNESLNGYLLRLAEENFLDSPCSLLRLASVRHKACYTDAELQLVEETLGLAEAALKSLSGFATVHGSLAQGKFLRTSSVPVCVHCLHEGGYIRQSWHHQLITACPEHHVLLMPMCPDCQDPLDLKRASVIHCRCGYCLLDAPVEMADPANMFISSLLTRSCDTAFEGMITHPQDLDTFLLFLANLTLALPHRKNAPVSWDRALQQNRASYEFCSDLLPRFKTFVEQRVEAANQLSSGRFMANLGGWYRELNTAFAGDVYAPVRDVAYRVILEHAQAPINRKMKQIGAELLGLKSTLTATEAARALKSSADRIVSLVKEKKLSGVILQGAVNEFCLVQRADVEAHQQAAADFINGKDLLKVLGTTRRVRDRLVEVGLLRPVPRDQRPLFACGEFRKIEAVSLLAELGQGCPELEKVAVGIALGDISGKRLSNQQANELFQRIFAGELKPIGYVQGMSGLSAFRFDEEEVLGALKQRSSLIEFTITDLTKVTRWKHETIKGWIDAGLLRGRVDPGGKHQVFVALTDLISFLSTHVVAADAADRLGSKSVWLMGPLKSAGVLVAGAHGTSAGTQRGVLFSIDGLVNIASSRIPTWTRPSKVTPRPSQALNLSLNALVDQFCCAPEVQSV